tara:strand:- start:1192 stop:1743 length:552 start_codon:yes stop_codon:yes gene_type:complete
MGLTEDLLKAKLIPLIEDGASKESIEKAEKIDSPLYKQAKAESDAIVNYLMKSNFTITQLKAPIVLENFRIPDQSVNVKLETLLGEYGPLLNTLRKIADPLGQGSLINALEKEIEKAVKPLTEGGSTLPGPDINKDDGGLEANGFVFIGEDPETQNSFDVSDEDGQREFTTVVLNEEDAKENQ